jgi:Domain of unknown function (DUF1906)
LTDYLTGCDYAFAPFPPAAALRASGIRFACRYLSYDPAKNLTTAEKSALLAEGVAIVLNWEQGSADMALGYNQGCDDATAADAQAVALGMASSPIYFSADFDADETQIAAAVEYMRGVNSVIGSRRSGVYGDYNVCAACVAAGVTTFTWGTPAWDGEPPAWVVDIYQYAINSKIAGANADFDAAYTNDFGQWPRPVVAPPDPPPVAVALRHVASGNYSLSAVAEAHATTFQALAQATRTSKEISAPNLARFNAYYDHTGAARTAMPKGLVYYSVTAFGGHVQ